MPNTNTSTTNQTIVARTKFIHTSPRKLRVVADAVRKMTPDQAINVLKNLNKQAARPLLLVYQQAVANAKNNFQISPGTLRLKALLIEEGPRGPKRMDKSHGARFDRGIKRKRLAHITLKLESITK